MTSTTLPRSDLGAGLAGWRGGDGPDLLLIHGVGLNADAWGPMIPTLSRHFTVTALDLPGHGGSAPLENTTAAALADFTSGVARCIAELGERPLIVGHSLGALIAMDLATTHPRQIGGAVALNAIYRRTDEASAAVLQRAAELAQGHKPSSAATLDRWFGTDQHDIRTQCKAMLEGCDPQAYATAYKVFAQSDAPPDAALRQTPCPMMFITGAQEPNSTPDMSHALARLVPDGRANVISGAKHMMPMTHAEAVNSSIVSFAHQTTP